MLDTYNVEVDFYNLKYLTVSWKIKPTTEDVSNYTFRVMRSLSPEGPFNPIIDLVDKFVYHDADVSLKNKYRKFFYIIRAFETADTDNYKDSSSAWLPEKPDLEAAEIIRRNDLLLRKKVGALCEAYLIKTYGQYCTNCFDYIKMRKRISNCPVCFNGGFVNGYFGPIATRVNFNPSQKMIQQAGFELQPDNIAAWMSNYPLLSPKDIVIESGTKRWRVVQQSQTEKRRIPVHQMLQLKRVNHSDIEYELPYVGLTDEVPNITKRSASITNQGA